MREQRLFLLAFLESARNRSRKELLERKDCAVKWLFPNPVQRRTGTQKRVAAAVINLPTAAAKTRKDEKIILTN